MNRYGKLMRRIRAGETILIDGATGTEIDSATISPQDYAAAASRWLDRGVHVIGGCCGIEPRHIRLLAQVIDEKRSG